MTETSISLHNDIQLVVDDSFPWRRDWIDTLGDFPRLQPASGDRPQVTIRLLYAPSLPLAEAREVDDGIHVAPSGVIDARHGVMLSWTDSNELTLRVKHPCLEWLMVAVQLAALRTGCTLVHSAAVAKDGMALVFPSWGGVGKTALVTRLVRQCGYELLGDDFVIVTQHGECRGFPKPMVLYPYHRPLFPEIFASGRGPSAPVAANRFLTSAAVAVKPLLRPFPFLLQLARRHNPQSVRINPSAVFGIDAIASSASLGAVLFLERVVGLSEVSLVPVAHSLSSRVFGTTLNEFNTRCVKVCNIALGAGQLSSRDFYGIWMEILERTFQGTRQYIVRIPEKFSVERMSDDILSLLDHSVFGLASS